MYESAVEEVYDSLHPIFIIKSVLNIEVKYRDDHLQIQAAFGQNLSIEDESIKIKFIYDGGIGYERYFNLRKGFCVNLARGSCNAGEAIPISSVTVTVMPNEGNKEMLCGTIGASFNDAQEASR